MNPRLTVRVSDQIAVLTAADGTQRRYRVSTAKLGTGFEEGSFKTPLGRFRIAEKFGDAMPQGTVFRDRVATGEMWTPNDPPGENLILTRILWLDGQDADNANTKDRYIYLHGTSNEHKLGTPQSQGCVTFSNCDIVEIFDLLPVGAEVEITA
jgi:lipoprotein-anchoring transpeptidase ErfK/SrfK